MGKPRQPEIDRQLRRLAGLSGYREVSEDGLIELGVALLNCAESDDHAEAIVSAYVRANRWMPTPSDFYAIAESSRYEHGEAPRPGARCKACGGSGWQRAWFLTTYTRHPNGDAKTSETQYITEEVYDDLRRKVDGIGQRVDTGAAACSCDYGRRLLAARLAAAQEQGGRK